MAQTTADGDVHHQLDVANQKIRFLIDVAVDGKVAVKVQDEAIQLIRNVLPEMENEQNLLTLIRTLIHHNSIPWESPPLHLAPLPKKWTTVRNPPNSSLEIVAASSPTSKHTQVLSKLREEAEMARQNLRTMVEIKDQEVQSLENTLQSINLQLEFQSKAARESADQASFLGSELSLRKLDIAKLSSMLATVQQESAQAQPVLPAALLSTQKTLAMNIASLVSPRIVQETATQTDDERRIDEESMGASENNVGPKQGIGVALPSCSVSSRSGYIGYESNEDDRPKSETSARKNKQLCTTTDQEEAKLQALLRAKDIVIDKLHRRIKNIEKDNIIDGAVGEWAEREKHKDREIRDLRAELSRLRREDSSICESSDLVYLKKIVGEYFTLLSRGNSSMANALIPVICALLQIPHEICCDILAAQRLPAPKFWLGHPASNHKASIILASARARSSTDGVSSSKDAA